MKVPTLEEIDKEEETYRKYLEVGGKPIRIILTMNPSNSQHEDAVTWSVEADIPDDLPSMMWLTMFAGYIKQRIIEAIRPPNMEGGEIETTTRN